MNSLILLVGIPGCGKSTWAARYVCECPDTRVVSTDEVRKDLTGSVDCKSCLTPFVYEEARRRAKEYLEQGHDVIIDSTNVDLREWIAYKKICPPGCLFVAKVFTVDPELSMLRQEGRERKVPKDILMMKWNHLKNNMQFLDSLFNMVL